LDIGVLGYIGIVQHKEHSPEVLSIPPGTPCIIAVLFSEDFEDNLISVNQVTVKDLNLLKAQ